METTKTNEPKDPELWELAQKRTSFKSHLAVYLVVNAFLWGVWVFTSQKHSDIVSGIILVSHGQYGQCLAGESGFSSTIWEPIFTQKKILSKENMRN